MSKESVVTPERFEHALTYADYVAGVAVNRDQFEHYYQTVRLTDDDVAFFRQAAARPSGPAELLAIAEAWCPDVFRGLPVFARIAEASNMTLRVVLRDENPDIMDEFLLNGTARAIPVAVFYTKDHRYIAHWIERPAVAHAEIARVKAEFSTHHPTVDLKTADRCRQTGSDFVLRRAAAAALCRMAGRNHPRDSRAAGVGAGACRRSTPHGAGPMSPTIPIVYTIRGCDACVKLLEKWNKEGIEYEERRAELSQATMDEARRYGDAVPIVVWPDGRVEQGFAGHIGCYII